MIVFNLFPLLRLGTRAPKDSSHRNIGAISETISHWPTVAWQPVWTTTDESTRDKTQPPMNNYSYLALPFQINNLRQTGGLWQIYFWGQMNEPSLYLLMKSQRKSDHCKWFQIIINISCLMPTLNLNFALK